MLTRQDTVALIIEHAENQGSFDGHYAALLKTLTIEQLDAELNRLEAIAIDCSTMPLFA